jgi:hypothetical protein
VCIKSKHGGELGLLSICPSPSSPGPYILVARSVTTQDFINFWGKFFAFVLLEMIEFSQGFKTFCVYLKALVENYFEPSIIFSQRFLCKLACKRKVLQSVL